MRRACTSVCVSLCEKLNREGRVLQANVGCGRELCCCDEICNFRFLQLQGRSQASAHPYSGGARPPLNFSGGGVLSTPGGSLSQISNLKIIIFLMILLLLFGIFIVCCFIE